MSNLNHSIIRRPIVTEKNTLHAHTGNEYAFEVETTARRKQIKEAIEKLFGVTVVRVNTMICRQSPKKLGKSSSTRRLYKKALVKLKEGDKFEFIAG